MTLSMAYLSAINVEEPDTKYVLGLGASYVLAFIVILYKPQI